MKFKYYFYSNFKSEGKFVCSKLLSNAKKYSYSILYESAVNLID